MSIAFNSGGLITRGMGCDHRLITRGFGIRFDFGGAPRRLKEAHFVLNLIAPILKEHFVDVNIMAPIEKTKNSSHSVYTSIQKYPLWKINMFAEVNNDKLLGILDEI